MKSLIMRLRETTMLFSEVFAIGRALEAGRITATQASNAISQAGMGSDLQELDRDSRVGVEVLPVGELVDAR